MNILLSNDDGVNAIGLAILAQTMRQLGKVTVVAPDRDRSGASNSLTLDAPLRISKQSNGFYMVNGTPTDCVHLAITGLLDEHPDMVISGINAGSNLGDDVLYSGTVAAAMEGRFLGYPAIAVSLVRDGCKENEPLFYETAALVTRNIITRLLIDPLPKETILNINVPNKAFDQLKGWQTSRLGYRHIAEHIIATKDPRGNPIYWVGPAGAEQDGGPGTDFYAINAGYVSITPIKTDLTDYYAIENVSKWVNNLKMD